MKQMRAIIVLFAFLEWLPVISQAQKIEWTDTYGGTSAEFCRTICTSSNGFSGYAIGGKTFSNNEDVHGNHGQQDAWILKIDAIGDTIWSRCYGGSLFDITSSIQATPEGGYISLGFTASTDGDVSGNKGNFDFWLFKISGAGTLLWQKCLGGSNDDDAESLGLTSDGGYILGGTTTSTDGDVKGLHSTSQDYWVVKTDGTGSLQWQKCLGGSGGDQCYSVQQTKDGGYIVGGSSGSKDGDVTGMHLTKTSSASGDAWIVKLDDTGHIQWQKCYGGSDLDLCYRIIQTKDGGYIFTGVATSNDGDVNGNHLSGSFTTQDIWVVKLNDTGHIQWQKCLGGSSYDVGYDIQQTFDGGYIITGYTQSHDGDVKGIHDPAAGTSDEWVIKLDDTGHLQWQRCMGGTSNDQGMGVIQTADSSYVIAGQTESNNYDVTGYRDPDSSSAYGDFWVVKLRDTIPTAVVPVITSNNSFEFYPNPTKGEFTIQIASTTTMANIEIYNLVGVKIYDAALNNTCLNTIDISTQPPGVYFIKLRSGDEVFVQRLVRE